MLLQELFTEANLNKEYAYQVEVDDNSSLVEFSSPPPNLKEIGFLIKIDDDGMMNEVLMDIIIGYRLSNIDILIEVPTEIIVSEKIDVKYLFNLSQNVDFSISILPPKESSDDYSLVIGKITDELLTRPNFDKFIYPVSNFLEYLMLEQVLGADALFDFRPEQKYLVEHYSSAMSKDDSDKFKQLIRDKLYTFYGSKEDFDLVAKSILETVLNKSESTYSGFIEESINKNN